MEAIRSPETSVNKISTWRHIPEDGILHSHRRENLKSHIYVCLPESRRYCGTYLQRAVAVHAEWFLGVGGGWDVFEKKGFCRWKRRVRKESFFRSSFFILSDHIINKIMYVYACTAEGVLNESMTCCHPCATVYCHKRRYFTYKLKNVFMLWCEIIFN
jgi:hypothetical protein